jgi:predicted hydrocarbon binding protein
MQDFYEIDAKEGIIVNKSAGRRAFVLGLDPWTSLVEKLSQNYGSGAEVILFGIGKSYGLSVAQEEERAGENQKLSDDFLSRMAAIAGWGKVTIHRNSPEKLKVKVVKCVFCAGLSDSSERRVPCFFLRGVISGVGEVLFNMAAKVEETHCGLDYCEFTVDLDPQPRA